MKLTQIIPISILFINSNYAVKDGPIQFLLTHESNKCLGHDGETLIARNCDDKLTNFVAINGKICLPSNNRHLNCISVSEQQHGRFTFGLGSFENNSKTIVFDSLQNFDDMPIKSPEFLSGRTLFFSQIDGELTDLQSGYTPNEDFYNFSNVANLIPIYQNEHLQSPPPPPPRFKRKLEKIAPRFFQQPIKKPAGTICSNGGEISTGTRLAERVKIHKSYNLDFTIPAAKFSKSVGPGVMSMVQNKVFTSVKLNKFQFRFGYSNNKMSVEIGDCQGKSKIIDNIKMVDDVEYKFKMTFTSTNNLVKLNVRGSDKTVVKNSYNVNLNCFKYNNSGEKRDAHSDGKTFVLYTSAPSINRSSANMKIKDLEYYDISNNYTNVKSFC